MKKPVLTDARGSVLPPRDIEITIITAIKTPTKLSPTIRWALNASNLTYWCPLKLLIAMVNLKTKIF